MKMRKCELTVELQGYWHIGSGRGDEAAADAIVARDASGLPYVPGRTLKGLLRAAMERASECGQVEAARVVELFGSQLAVVRRSQAGASSQEEGEKISDSDRAETELEEGRFDSQGGKLAVGSARLSPAWRQWAKQPEASEVVDELTRFVASTAMDEHGTARNQTLRVREVAVPMTLRATLHGPDDDPRWIEEIETSLVLLRALGSRRNRGYGRVAMSLKEVGA